MPGRRERRTEESLARLRERLHAEADRHRPDTARIWARVEAAMAEPEPAPPADAAPARRPRRRRGVLWAAATGLSTAAVLGVTSAAVLMTADRDDDGSAVSLGRHSTGQPPTPAASDLLPATTPPAETSDKNAVVTGPRPTRRPTGRPTGAPNPGNTLVSAVGSLDRGSSRHWARNNLVLTVRRPLAALDITVRVRGGRGTFPAGGWTSLPGSDVRSDTGPAHDGFVYRYRLLPGRTVAPGVYLVGAQYRPGEGHDASRDTFTVTAAGTGGGPSVTVNGHF